jgi:transcriptional regulator with XRE-family HTH domain
MENCLYTLAVMARKSKLKLPPLDTGGETLGQRIARLRKERGYTQTELAERIGIIQALVSDYERGKLRLSADMAIRFATALEVSTEDLLRPNDSKPLRRKPSRRVLRRMERIQELPPRRQYFVLKALDALLGSSATK